MFCPVCEAEYRPGFAKCSDCGVDLVAELPLEDSPFAYAILWKGEDAIFHDALVTELEKAGIAYADTPLHVYLRRNANVFGPNFGPLYGFVISVPSEALRPARSILERLLDIEPDTLPYEIYQSAEDSAMGETRELPHGWDASTAKIELSSGKIEKNIAFLEDALHEVGIPSRREAVENGILRVMVRPEDEGQARAIFKQIEEQAAPADDLPEPRPAIWEEEPVRSYALLCYLAVPPGLFALFVMFDSRKDGPLHDLALILSVPFALLAAVSNIGSYWMMYQAIRYEVRPLRFFLLAFLPLACVWYYFERYANRRASGRLPISVRVRMRPPQT